MTSKIKPCVFSSNFQIFRIPPFVKFNQNFSIFWMSLLLSDLCFPSSRVNLYSFFPERFKLRNASKIEKFQSGNSLVMFLSSACIFTSVRMMLLSISIMVMSFAFECSSTITCRIYNADRRKNGGFPSLFTNFEKNLKKRASPHTLYTIIDHKFFVMRSTPWPIIDLCRNCWVSFLVIKFMIRFTKVMWVWTNSQFEMALFYFLLVTCVQKRAIFTSESI